MSKAFQDRSLLKNGEDDVEMEIENVMEDSPLEISFRARQEWRHHKSCNFKVS